MKHHLFTTALLATIPSLTYADPIPLNVELDIGITEVEHAWRGINNYADYDSQLKSIGLTLWHENNFGIRFAHGTGSTMTTQGRYKDYYIELPNISSLELLYKVELTDRARVFGGIGTNLIPLPTYKDVRGSVRADRDDDEGYILGLSYNVLSNLRLIYRFTEYSLVKSAKYERNLG